MAFLPERNHKEYTLATSYNLSNGASAFTSVDISRFTIISFQIVANSVTGVNTFQLEQSADGTNWVPLKDIIYELSSGGGSLVIEKSAFSGKYVRLDLIDTDSGTISIFLTCKR